MQHQFKLTNLSDTSTLAAEVAKLLPPGFVIALNGNLGSGKTTFTREVLCSLGAQGTIKSPTFTLVEQYLISKFEVYHFDLYRFNDPDEWFYAGFDEYFHSGAVCFIEWAEKASNLIPKIDWIINIGVIDENKRDIVIEEKTSLGKECLTQLIINVAS